MRVSTAIRISSLAIALVILGGCATPDSALPGMQGTAVTAEAKHQQKFTLVRRLRDLQRVQTAGYHVLRANRLECGQNVARSYGFYVVNADTIPKALRPSAVELWHLDHRLVLLYAISGSAADKAGLRAGDKLIQVGGQAVPTGRGALQGLGALLKQNAKQNRRFSISVLRDNQQKTVQITPDVKCNYPIVMAYNNAAGAHTDGKRIVIQRGLLRVAESDDQLALVIGHELAHITKGHFGKKKQNAMMAGAGGLAVDIGLALLGVNSGGAFTKQMTNVGAGAFSQEFEKEADYVGMYYTALAGYRTDSVGDLWRRMADEDPKQITYSGSHPTHSERFILIDKTHKEIQAKKQQNLPLTPNKKSKRIAQTPAQMADDTSQ